MLIPQSTSDNIWDIHIQTSNWHWSGTDAYVTLYAQDGEGNSYTQEIATVNEPFHVGQKASFYGRHFGPLRKPSLVVFSLRNYGEHPQWHPEWVQLYDNIQVREPKGRTNHSNTSLVTIKNVSRFRE